jgi:hypothetical protein
VKQLEDMMSDTSLENLRTANRVLGHGLLRLRQDGLRAVGNSGLAGLRRHLSQAGCFVRGLDMNQPLPSSVETELWQYRQRLRELAQLLPALQTRLLAEKMRLQAARERHNAVHAWVEAQKSVSSIEADEGSSIRYLR